MYKIKDAYLLWHSYYIILPKSHRHSLGQRIDVLFVETIEVTATACFLQSQDKIPYIRLAIRKIDTFRILLMVMWEVKSLDDKQYISLSVKIDEIGKMLGGWFGKLSNQNSPVKTGEK